MTYLRLVNYSIELRTVFYSFNLKKLHKNFTIAYKLR